MRVLVAIDGSERAGVAVDLVADVAWPAGTEILVAEAVESGAGLFGGSDPALTMIQADTLEAELRVAAKRTVDGARAQLERPDLTVQCAVLRGRPATAIIDRTRDMRADLIVVGSRGHGTIESMLLGSVSAEVIDHAPVPVLASSSAASPAMSSSTQRARFSSFVRALHRPIESRPWRLGSSRRSRAAPRVGGPGPGCDHPLRLIQLERRGRGARPRAPIDAWCRDLVRSYRNGAAANSSTAGRTTVIMRTASATTRVARTSSNSIGHTLPGGGSDL